MAVTENYTARNIPLSLIAIDYYSWAPLPPGDEDFGNKTLWPDPAYMVIYTCIHMYTYIHTHSS